MQNHIETLKMRKKIKIAFEVIEVWNAFVNYLDTEYKTMIWGYLNNWLCSPISLEIMAIDGIKAWIKCYFHFNE